MAESNRQMVLARRPVGAVRDDDFAVRSVPMPEPGPGEALVRVEWLSFDPTQRGWLNDVESYMPPVQLGEVMRASGVGTVVASNADGFVPGDLVQGMFGWQEYAIGSPSGLVPMMRLPAGVEPAAALSVYGITGLTAYFGMLDLGRPQPGDTVYVSGAAGATGSVAGQIAKRKGCRVIGSAGGPDKCAWVRDVAGFDAVIDYRSEDISERLGALAPDGLDIYFDNIGGSTLEAALDHLAMKARVVLCGGISSGYTAEARPPGPSNLMNLVTMRARMEGFLILDYLAQFGPAIGELAGWVADGSIRYEIDVQHGLEAAPATLRRLFEGKNLGKQLLQL